LSQRLDNPLAGAAGGERICGAGLVAIVTFSSFIQTEPRASGRCSQEGA
jgi:hypothetical protein